MKKVFLILLAISLLLCAQSVLSESSKAIFGGLSVGGVISFGHFEQDGNEDNGPEEIEWIVLNMDGEYATLISKYVLDAKAFNDERITVTWESCTLRQWLNNGFFNKAFTETEQALIRKVIVTADKNLQNSTAEPGNDTLDQVYLLSVSEAKRWFESDKDRVAYPTDVAASNGARYWVDEESVFWWLRTPGSNSDWASAVGSQGKIDRTGTNVDKERGGVRPVITIRFSE